MSKPKSVESRVADAILQRNCSEVVGGVTYEVAPPTSATIIMTSELIAEMPTIRPAKEFPEQLQEVLRIGRDCKVTGDILALLILGPNNLIEEKEEVKSYLFGLFKRKRVVVIDKQKELAKKLLTEVEPKELFELGARLFERIQAPYFFALTTSLSDVNILRPTKEVD